ncbi:MAG TPA: hypothetical protein QF624_09515 [Dehalococcoidia bacterium]|nr:hypothetical protein [Dehalococcoidia bacterium]
MTATPQAIERQITAYIDNEESLNVIHDPKKASEYGYQAALVTGVVTYGWAVPAIIEAVGESWPESGWVEMAFRRPVYDGDEITLRVTPQPGDGDAFDWLALNADEDRCVIGSAGAGRAPWFDELTEPPARRTAEPAADPKVELTLANAPLGEELRPMGVAVSLEEAAELASRVRDDDPRWSGDGALVHPNWLASQMYRLLLHSYDFYPSMHVRSQIQQLALARAGQTLTMAATFLEAYERKVHHYATLGGSIFAEDGTEVFRVRYSTVFHIAKREQDG